MSGPRSRQNRIQNALRPLCPPRGTVVLALLLDAAVRADAAPAALLAPALPPAVRAEAAPAALLAPVFPPAVLAGHVHLAALFRTAAKTVEKLFFVLLRQRAFRDVSQNPNIVGRELGKRSFWGV